MSSACRTAPYSRKYPSLSPSSTSIPFFGLEPLLRSCRRSQHLFMSITSVHVDSNISSCHVDNIHSCRQHPLVSTTSTRVDNIHSCRVIPSHRPHTFMSTSISLLVDIDFHLLLSTSISCHLCVHLFHVEHIKYIINSGQVYHHRCRLSISSIPAKYIIIDVDRAYHHRCRPSISSSMSTKYVIDVDQVCHRCRPGMSSMSTLYIMPRQRSTAQYEGILPVTSTFRSWSVRLSTTIVSCMSFLLS
jgi:hypothetical protein